MDKTDSNKWWTTDDRPRRRNCKGTLDLRWKTREQYWFLNRYCTGCAKQDEHPCQKSQQKLKDLQGHVLDHWKTRENMLLEQKYVYWMCWNKTKSLRENNNRRTRKQGRSQAEDPHHNFRREKRKSKARLLVECRAKWLNQCCYNIFLPSVVLRICSDRKTASSRYDPRLRPFLLPSVAAWHFLSRFIQQQPLPFLLD